jgi:hypothetical protein
MEEEDETLLDYCTDIEIEDEDNEWMNNLIKMCIFYETKLSIFSLQWAFCVTCDHLYCYVL